MKYLVTQLRLFVCSLLVRWCVSIAPADDAEGQIVLQHLSAMTTAWVCQMNKTEGVAR